MNPRHGAGLQDPDLAALINGPFNVLRRSEMSLQFEHVVAELLQESAVQVHVFVARLPLDDGCLCELHNVSCRSGPTRDELLAEAPTAFEQRVILTPRGRVNGEGDASHGGIDHRLDQDAHPRQPFVEPVLAEIRRHLRALRRVTTFGDRLQQLRRAPDLEPGDVLTREAGPGQILQVATGPRRHREAADGRHRHLQRTMRGLIEVDVRRDDEAKGHREAGRNQLVKRSRFTPAGLGAVLAAPERGVRYKAIYRICDAESARNHAAEGREIRPSPEFARRLYRTMRARHRPPSSGSSRAQAAPPVGQFPIPSRAVSCR